MHFQSADRVRIGIIAAILPLLAACGDGVSAPKGPTAKAELTILQNATAIMLAVIVPVIVLTARTASSTREEARQLGVAEYMNKPFDPDQLIETMRKHAGGAPVPG